ncbi:Ger(x)C family spore germination protein [Brevibacillus choshinensis]|uniref:Ger(x)C family spore germination protein n=1 Tax=Brevibacillus choshinensis TaxID=54911 RepID=UPI002E211D50|nr:Ger(x)C family spore germination protein [Brevibacillus choshinensis]
MKKYFLVLIMTLALPSLLMGCWGRQELNTVAIIHTIAVDKGKNNHVRLTIEISELISQGQAPIGLKGKPFYLTSEGETIFEAARDLRNSSSRYLIWGHANAIVFSQELAKKGIKKHIDVLMRLRHFRNTMNVFIADGRADDVFTASIPQQSFIAIGLSGLVDAQKSTANTLRITMIQVTQSLTNKYKALTIPAVQLFQHPHSNKKSLRTLGLYLFKDDKLHSFMDVEKTKAYVRSINEAQSAVETLSCGKKQERITFENVKNQTKIRSEIQGNQPRITLELFADFNIVDVQCGVKITTKQIEYWEKQLDLRLKQQVQDLIRYSQNHKIDLLGIGELIHREHPTVWKLLKKNWNQKYPHVPFQIVIKSRIEHSSLLS